MAKAEGDLSIIANEFSWRCESIDLCCWTVPPVRLDAAGAVMKKLLSGPNLVPRQMLKIILVLYLRIFITFLFYPDVLMYGELKRNFHLGGQ